MALSTRQLEAFQVLSATRNFTRAAKAFHLSQPAFSALIRSLEDELCARLFDRDKRTVTLTPAGRAFEASASRILAEARLAITGLSGYSETPKELASIAILPSLAACWFPPVLASFLLNHPSISIEVADHFAHTCVELTRAGHVDFAIVSRYGDAGDLLAQELACERFYLACSPANPLAQQSHIRVRDIAEQTFIYHFRSSMILQYLDSVLYPRRMEGVLTVEQYSTVLALVQAGIGITAVTSLSLPLCKSLGLHTREMPTIDLKRRSYLIRRKGDSMSPAAAAMYEHILDHRPNV